MEGKEWLKSKGGEEKLEEERRGKREKNRGKIDEKGMEGGVGDGSKKGMFSRC